MMVESSHRGWIRADKKRQGLFVAWLCAASCAAGQLLFGQEPSEGLAPAKGLKPAAIQAVFEPPLLETKPRENIRATKPVAEVKQPNKAPEVKAVSTGNAAPGNAATNSSATSGEEHLAPIVPAWAVPRPGKKGQGTGAR